jgi:hypothetical protein
MAACFVDSADIRVRVISAKTGSPMAGKLVRLSVNVGTSQGVQVVFDDREHTTSDGMATFKIAHLPPTGTVIVTDIDPDQCSPAITNLTR